LPEGKSLGKWTIFKADNLSSSTPTRSIRWLKPSGDRVNQVQIKLLLLKNFGKCVVWNVLLPTWKTIEHFWLSIGTFLV